MCSGARGCRRPHAAPRTPSTATSLPIGDGVVAHILTASRIKQRYPLQGYVSAWRWAPRSPRSLVSATLVRWWILAEGRLSGQLFDTCWSPCGQLQSSPGSWGGLNFASFSTTFGCLIISAKIVLSGDAVVMIAGGLGLRMHHVQPSIKHAHLKLARSLRRGSSQVCLRPVSPYEAHERPSWVACVRGASLGGSLKDGDDGDRPWQARSSIRREFA